MDWAQVASLFVANAALIAWFRSESRDDWKHMDQKLDIYRNETNNLINAIKEEMKEFHTKLALQDLEFKNRLCAIEERNRR